MFNLTIPGTPPSKKNGRNIFKRGGRVFNIPSAKHNQWASDASFALMKHKYKIVGSITCVTLTFFMHDNRRRDLTNMAEGVMDIMVKSEVFEDDCVQVIPRLVLILGGVDKKNPRTDVIIEVR